MAVTLSASSDSRTIPVRLETKNSNKSERLSSQGIPSMRTRACPRGGHGASRTDLPQVARRVAGSELRALQGSNASRASTVSAAVLAARQSLSRAARARGVVSPWQRTARTPAFSSASIRGSYGVWSDAKFHHEGSPATFGLCGSQLRVPLSCPFAAGHRVQPGVQDPAAPWPRAHP